MDYQFDVFLCHNSQDKPAVREISRQLKEYQLKTWLDEEQLRPGDSTWQKSLQTQINQIRASAVFIGQSGLGPWQEEEVEAFLVQFQKRKCPVIPVLLKETSAEIEIPPFLEIRTWVDFRHPETRPFEKLIWAITGRKPLSLIISEVFDKSLQSILNENNLNLSEKLAKDFLDILSSIDDYDLFSKILDDPRIRIQTSGSDIDKYSKILRDNLRDKDNKFGELIRFFLIHYPDLNLILTFANLLKSNLQEVDNKDIKNWIDKIQKNSANLLSFSSSEELKQTAINAHLMIVVSNWSAGEYRLNSFLLSDVSDLCHDIVEIINGHQQDDKGFVCKSLNDIKKRSLQCIHESQKILNSEKKIKKLVFII
ncbi:MAG: toll/interleukin-1 receptor domain-containing protein [Thermosynechococcaceae cyanobacterium]